MPECDVCGKRVDLPYDCNECGGTYCAEHRLPESHDCSELADWGDPDGVFDSGFDDSVATARDGSGGLAGRLGVDTRGGLVGYVRGNAAFLFLGLMWVTWGLQQLVLQGLPQFGVLTTGQAEALHNTLFVLQADELDNVWTYVTSIFAHNPYGFFHIVGNSLVFYFFGTAVEDYVGSRDFFALAIVSGVLAGLGQVLLAAFVFGDPTAGVLGASGAGLAILGVMTVLNPNARIFLLIPPIPVPIWVLTGFYAVMSSVGVLAGGAVGGGGAGIAHAAHLLGLAVGLLYGQYVKDEVDPRGEYRVGGFGGRGPGGPGGPGGRL